MGRKNGKEKKSPSHSPTRSPKQNQSPPHNLEVMRSPHNFEAMRSVVPKSLFGMYLSGDSGDPTRLHVAITEGDIKTVKGIARKDKDLICIRDKNGRIALHWAVVLGTHKITKFILKNTSWWYLDRCDYNGCTPLHYAAQAGSSDATRMLLNRGAYANARDNRNRTPLHYAALVGNAFIIQKLVEHKGNLWLEDKDGNLPIDLTENPDVIALVQRLMKPKFSCLRLCFPKRVEKKGTKLSYDNKFPYIHKANKVKRCLPKDMLKDMMVADAKRNKHGLEHKEVSHPK